MLKLTLTSALIGAASAAPTYTNMCPKAICTGTATAVAKVLVKAATKYKCTEVTKAAKPAGCTDAVPTADFAAATCISVAGTGKSTKLLPATPATKCAFVKTGANACNWMCPDGCTNGVTITGNYMDGYVKGVAAVAKKTLPCTAATQIFPKCTAATYTAAVCKDIATAKIFDFAKSTTTCVSKLATCVPGTSPKNCPAGCTSKAATYTGAEKYDVPAVLEVKAVAGTSTVCTAANIGKDKLGTCISTPACTGTATYKGTNEGTTVPLPGVAGTMKTTCAVSQFETSAAKCDAGCTFTAMKAGAYTGTSTADDPSTAVTAADGYQPICSTSCMSQRFQPTIQTTKTNVGCAPGCTITAPVPVVPAVAPSPAKSSSASAATMAAATIALSAIAAIVAL